MQTLSVIFIAISISLDAFSLALAYGLININKTHIFISILVGIFHFFMPLLGLTIGNYIIMKIPINPKYIISIIFIIIIFEMIKSFHEQKEKFYLNVLNIFLFAFLVSLDSFSVGIGLNYITNYPIKACIIFTLFSAVFTFIGFSLGKYISKKIGNISKIIGILLLTFLVLYYLCK